MSAFVVEYHLVSGDYRVTEFTGEDGRRAAMDRRISLEQAHPGDDGWEIVSLNADSLETIKETHSRYFQGQELSPVS